MKEAYVTFVMRNDSYIPGALVLGYRLRKLSIEKALVCMITKEISETGRTLLSCIFDFVVEVDEIYVHHNRKQERQDRPYLFTRFQALRLGSDGDLGFCFDKIVLLDADILPLHSYEELFELDGPAGIINENKSHCISDHDRLRTDGKSVWHDIYESVCPHGKRIPIALTNQVIAHKDNMGVNAALWVLKPCMAEYHKILVELDKQEVMALIQEFNWPEMQFATYFWSGKWTNVDIRYAAFNGLPKLSSVYGSHFAGLKPWNDRKVKALQHYIKYPDYQLWYQEFYEMSKWVYPEFQESPKIRRILWMLEHELKEGLY